DALVGGGRRARVGEADVAVERDALALGVKRQLRVLELVRAAERRAGVAGPPDHLLLLTQADAVPELHVHPADAHALAGSAARPRRAGGAPRGPGEAIHERAVAHVGVGRAVAEREQVARGVVGRGPAARALEPVDGPAQLERAADGAQQLAQGVDDGVAVPG